MPLRRRLAFCLAVLALLSAAVPTARAQADLSPRFGLGAEALLSTEDGFGIGLRGRASAPVNADVSVALDLGLTGFIFGGRDDATYLFNPQLSAVINLPFREGHLPYLLAGLGAHLPFSDDGDSVSGPVIHLGFGRVQSLQDTSVFYEINPGLLIGENNVDLLIPVRIGIIF